MRHPLAHVFPNLGHTGETFGGLADMTGSARRNRLYIGLAIFALAFGVRAGIVLARGDYRVIERTEVVLVAASLADHGAFANAYAGESGATAHASPLYPLLLSVVFAPFESPQVPRACPADVRARCRRRHAWLPALVSVCGVRPSVGIAARARRRTSAHQFLG
ncbi:MAG: hypothetical protein R2748_30585 [Bryobacterales bacterium]